MAKAGTLSLGSVATEEAESTAEHVRWSLRRWCGRARRSGRYSEEVIRGFEAAMGDIDSAGLMLVVEDLGDIARQQHSKVISTRGAKRRR